MDASIRDENLLYEMLYLHIFTTALKLKRIIKIHIKKIQEKKT